MNIKIKLALLLIFTLLIASLSWGVVNYYYEEVSGSPDTAGTSNTDKVGAKVTFNTDNGTCIQNITLYDGGADDTCRLYKGTNIATDLIDTMTTVGGKGNFTCNATNNWTSSDTIYILCGDGVSLGKKYSNTGSGDSVGTFATYKANSWYDNGGTISSYGTRHWTVETVGLRIYKNTTGVAETSNIDLLFSADTDLDTYKILFDEREDFHGFINWTDKTSTALNDTVGDCNITLLNSTLETDFTYDNFTLCDTGCNYTDISHTFLKRNDIVINDNLHFNICHTGGIEKDLNVTFLCASTDVNIIPKGNIPLCETGTLRVNSFTTDCTTDTAINISMENEANTQSQGHRISNLGLDRQYSRVIDEMHFNETKRLWKTNLSYNFYMHGEKTIYGNCSHNTIATLDNSKSETVTIVNIPPKILFSAIKTEHEEKVLTNNTNYEYTDERVYLVISISDDDLDSLLVNITNSSGNVINTSTEKGIIYSFDGSAVRDSSANPIKVNVWANDTTSNQTEAFFLINFTDSINPSCTGLGAESTTAGNFTFNIVCTDDSVYLFNISCTNGFNHTETGLNVDSYTLANSTNITTDTVCSAEICDGHTTEWLEKSWYLTKEDNKIDFTIDKFKTSLVSLDNDTFDYEVKTDRVEFEVAFKDKSKNSHTLYYVAGKDSHYLPSDKWRGWINDVNSRTWFDLNTEFPTENIIVSVYHGDCEQITGKSCTGEEKIYKIDISTSLDIVQFKSIGELNCVSYTKNINVVTPSTDIPLFRGFKTTAHALGFIFLYSLWLGVIAFFLKIRGVNNKRIQALNMFQLFIGFVTGISFISVSFVIGFATVFIAVGFFIATVKNS